jgi:hypothetical protein
VDQGHEKEMNHQQPPHHCTPRSRSGPIAKVFGIDHRVLRTSCLLAAANKKVWFPCQGEREWNCGRWPPPNGNDRGMNGNGERPANIDKREQEVDRQAEKIISTFVRVTPWRAIR